MGQRVAFATSNWKDKPDKPDSMTQAEWDAYNSSEFNGFPFPIIEKNENNEDFGEWNKFTVYTNLQKGFDKVPSGSREKLVSVLGDHYSFKFTYDQLFELFWRMKSCKIKFNQFKPWFTYSDGRDGPFYQNEVYSSSEASRTREIDFSVQNNNWVITKDEKSSEKVNEAELVSEMSTNKWRFKMDMVSDFLEDVEINFNMPVLKLGEDDYRPYVNSFNSRICTNGPLYPPNLFGIKYNFEDLPSSVNLAAVSFFEGPVGPFIFNKLSEPRPSSINFDSGGERFSIPVMVFYEYLVDGSTIDTGYSNAFAKRALGISGGKWTTVYENYEIFYGESAGIETDCNPCGVPDEEMPQYFGGDSLFYEAVLYSDDGQNPIVLDPFPDSISFTFEDVLVNLTRGNRVALGPSYYAGPNTQVLPAVDCFINRASDVIEPYEGYLEELIAGYYAAVTGWYKGYANIGEAGELPFSLYYDYGVRDEDSCKWTLQTPYAKYRKSGTQDTPLGNYGPFTIS
jgi:hypothetical protein